MFTADFFAQPTLQVAQALLGQRLVRDLAGQRLSGLIVETEAYIGRQDTASHAHRGRTPRSAVMFGPAGRTYVYLIYGMYAMLNIVTEPEPFPAAVLIRALEPLEGLALMRTHRRRGRARAGPERELTNGPGKLCQALQIDRSLNQWDITLGQQLWLEAGPAIPREAIATGPRLNIDYAAPADRAAPWRFWLAGNRFVSKGAA
jgi:DNA-3-methyladenine glycosylase